MSLRSFKRPTHPPQIRIRTPSPPRDAIEPLTPPLGVPSQARTVATPTRSPKTHRRVKTADAKPTVPKPSSSKQKHTKKNTESSGRQDIRRPSSSYAHIPVSPIDALATAASSLAASPVFAPTELNSPQLPLATSNGALWSSGQIIVKKRTTSEQDDRPSKRARSEMLPSPMHLQNGGRPATSYVNPRLAYDLEHMMDNGKRVSHGTRRLSEVEERQRRQEAELLLFLASSKTAKSPKALSHAKASASSVTSSSSATEKKDEQNENVHKGSSPSAASAVQTQTPPEDTISADAGQCPNVDLTDAPAQAIKVEHQSPTQTSLAKAARNESASATCPSADIVMQEMVQDQLQSPRSLGQDEKLVGASNGNVVMIENDDELGPLREEVIDRQRRKSAAVAPTKLLFANEQTPQITRAASVPLQRHSPASIQKPLKAPATTTGDIEATTVCPACNFASSLSGEMKNWIECSGCKQWYHFACAGFRNDREVGRVDKFFCKTCKPQHGPTTYLRKSARAHTAVDYAGLNEGVVKTSDDTHEHHYIQHIKDGNFRFDPENFPRMRPELVTAENFEKSGCFTEPIVIPGEWNPRPHIPGSENQPVLPISGTLEVDEPISHSDAVGDLLEDFEYDPVPDEGQDKLDMVIPQGLTVRRVADLYGPEEPVEVIEVKTQEGSDKKWNLSRWADYYEEEGEKVIRNVISLEVSTSKLGRLIRRPKVVRDLDLQDAVWPQEEIDRGVWPKVQFYCLMSVADSYTDFHIDFGGSSVYYHIMQGKKTFFFIPPKAKHFKKYEDWCLSPAQNHTFLGDQTKECYRVDLSAGDTMLIPSGWIHAVWTPENSLVIGGNFLTRMHYEQQIKVAEIEKATKVARKFRYPHFQKVQWYAVLKYLEEDPLPQAVAQLFYERRNFHRDVPIYYQTNNFGHNSLLGPENYNCRYYSQQELDSLPALVRFVHRTVMISLGKIENITIEVRNAVSRSIPKGRGDPLEIIKTFAAWVAWKRGNEDLPEWAHPDAVLPESDPKFEKKPQSAVRKQPERPNAFLTERQQIQQLMQMPAPSLPAATTTNEVSTPTAFYLGTPTGPNGKHLSTPKTSQLGPKRIACDACRKRRIRCKHKDDVVTGANGSPNGPKAQDSVQPLHDLPGPSSNISAGSPEASNPFTNGIDAASTGDSLVRSAQKALNLSNGAGVLESSDGKKGRNKACVDCRRSKRRCIHDENGAIDPVKAQEAKIPRGTTSHKKRRYMEIVERSQRERKEAGSQNGLPDDYDSQAEDTNETMDYSFDNQAPVRMAFGHPVHETFDDGMDLVDTSQFEDSVMYSIEGPSGVASDHANDLIDPSLMDPSLSAVPIPQTPGNRQTPNSHAPVPTSLNDLAVSPNFPVNGAHPSFSAEHMSQTSRQPHSINRASADAVVRRLSYGASSTTAASPFGTRKDSKPAKASSASPFQAPPVLDHIKTEAEIEEENSLKLARELQEEDWGLRRRRS